MFIFCWLLGHIIFSAKSSLFLQPSSLGISTHHCIFKQFSQSNSVFNKSKCDGKSVLLPTGYLPCTMQCYKSRVSWNHLHTACHVKFHRIVASIKSSEGNMWHHNFHNCKSASPALVLLVCMFLTKKQTRWVSDVVRGPDDLCSQITIQLHWHSSENAGIGRSSIGARWKQEGSTDNY